MVFSSIPTYLDPANWHQANTDQQQPAGGVSSSGGTTTSSSSHQQIPVVLSSAPVPVPLPAPGSGHGSIRPGSMADQARMCNLPMPEAALKCPRCDSTNTKFCYFNNYNLTQPRHFCKTCRRYWTRGGALRTVPVGGGCRRNKRTKSSSKSPAAVGGTGSTSIPISSNANNSSSNSTSSSGGGVGLLAGLNPQIHPLRFMAPLSQLGEFTHGGDNIIGLNYGSGIISSHLNHEMNSFSLGGGGGGVGRPTFLPAITGSSSGTEPWRFQPQISSFVGLEGPGAGGGMFPLHGNNVIEPRPPKLSMSVKMEDQMSTHHGQGLNLSRQFVGMQGNDNNQHQQQQYVSNWGSGINAGGSTSSWTDLSGFSSSSTTSNPL